MNDTLITVVAIFLAAILMLVFPLVNLSSKVDTVSNTNVEELTTDFVNTIKTTGKITLKEYDSYINQLGSTGNTYDVSMEVKKIGDNPGKKTLQSAKDKIGENYYISDYTSQIVSELENNGVYNLKQGDIVSVTAKNTNTTLGQKMRNFLYSMVGSDTYKLSTTQSGMVTATQN